MPSSSANLPSESTHDIDLNIPNDVAPISVVAGVHNEEVGDFSENEDDIIAQHVDDNEDPERLWRRLETGKALSGTLNNPVVVVVGKTPSNTPDYYVAVDDYKPPPTAAE
ncbi:hypothetical protein TSUD_395040 [Trifolium subterraneum]|uniref:Uncharacterized protein n=1 Tax=Trifolium subterraneum TaxID=3900 RepID=A0A2Z6MY76_TRISU|nr:hypothetical protein TSUD_395040 [Trifolium subterraneum]